MACDTCRKDKGLMMGMEPGPDGINWELCLRCWSQGTATKKPANTLEHRAARK